jgi:hypothetical protein
MYCLVYYLFIFLFIIAYFWSLSLGANDFENLQELDFQDFEQQPAEEQGKWPLICSNMISLSCIHKLHAIIGSLSFHTLGLVFYD